MRRLKRKKLNEIIKKFDLNLDGLTVLTERAIGPYYFTHVIAEMAGAKKVYAIRKNSDKTVEMISEADIITNLGRVRPIDKEFISYMKPTAVIPLMFETWEFREEDIDLAECKKKGICVLGTNEDDIRLQTMNYVAHLCAKKLYRKKIPIYHCKIAVLGTSRFGVSIRKLLQNMGAKLSYIRSADVIVIADPNIEINDEEDINKPIIRMWQGNHMTWTLANLSWIPVVELNTAGLKVGEIMARLRLNGYTPSGTISEALRNSLCQGWNGNQGWD